MPNLTPEAVLDAIPADVKISTTKLRKKLQGYTSEKLNEVIGQLVNKRLVERVDRSVKRIPNRPDNQSKSKKKNSQTGPKKNGTKTSSDYEKLLLDLVGEGTKISNSSLKGKFVQKANVDDEELFWNTRAGLIETGLLEKLRGGPGGSTFRPTSKRVSARKARESSLYPDISKYVNDEWVQQCGYGSNDKKLVQIITAQGRGGPGGMWTRPDLVFIALRTYTYLPDETLDLVSFEVKRAGEYNVDGCFQTAAHSKFAHKSYLVIQIDDDVDLERDTFQRLEEECARFQVGLIVFKDAKSIDSYEIRLDCARKSPDPAEVDRFIGSHLINETNKASIRQWRKTTVTFEKSM